MICVDRPSGELRPAAHLPWKIGFGFPHSGHSQFGCSGLMNLRCVDVRHGEVNNARLLAVALTVLHT